MIGERRLWDELEAELDADPAEWAPRHAIHGRTNGAPDRGATSSDRGATSCDPLATSPELMAQPRAKASRNLPPRRRSSLGPFTFLLAVALLVVGVYAVALPLAEDAAVAYVTEHDTLLRQDFVRGFVADRVQSEVDLAKDTRADNRPFVIARGETAGEIGKRLEQEGVIRSALAFDFVLYETERENALQSGTYTVSAATRTHPLSLRRWWSRRPGQARPLRIPFNRSLSASSARFRKRPAWILSGATPVPE